MTTAVSAAGKREQDRQAAIDRIVATAPPLSDRQRLKLELYFRSGEVAGERGTPRR